MKRRLFINTLDPAAAETRFVMWNDTHVHDESIRALHEQTPAADFLLWNGDTCNDWTKDELLVPTLLHPGGRDLTEKQPLFIAWGNHDVRGAHATWTEGMADASRLRLKVTDLEGKILQDLALPPLS